MIGSSEHLSINRMNEAVDGLLSAAEMREVETHVDQCAVCRDEYARISEVVRAVRTLPRTAAAPDAAWSGILSRISAPDIERVGEDETPVIALGRAGHDERAAGSGEGSGGEHGERKHGAGRRVRAGIYLTLSQLAAAAVLVAVVSATIVWIGMNGGSAVPAGVPLVEEATGTPAGGAAARAVSLESGRYTEAVAALEDILEEGRNVLDPETLFTIEESLRSVDEAIADVEKALAEDPNSALLLRLLANQQRTKLGVLQRAADAVHAQT